jgi:predicted DNA-binding protein
VVTVAGPKAWSPPSMSVARDAAAIGVDADLLERLRALSRRTGRPGAELLREALVPFLAAREDYRLPSWVAVSARRRGGIDG